MSTLALHPVTVNALFDDLSFKAYLFRLLGHNPTWGADHNSVNTPPRTQKSETELDPYAEFTNSASHKRE